MEEERVARPRRVRAVEPNDVVVLVFDPNAAQEAAVARALLGGHVEHQAAHVAQEFAAHVAEVIVLAIEVVAIREDHPGEAERLVLHLEELAEAAEQLFLHARVVFDVVLAIDGRAQVHAAQEIPVILRHRTESRVKRQVLQIGLNHGRTSLQHFDQALFTQHEAIDHLIHGGRRRSRLRGRWLLVTLRLCLLRHWRRGGHLDRGRLRRWLTIGRILRYRTERQQQGCRDHPIQATHNSYLHVS